jgi:predicted transcriptional regulator
MTISNPADKKKIKDAISEISDSMTRIEAERDLIKEIKAKIVEDHEITKKAVNALAKVYHKNSYTQVEAEQEEFTLLYETLFETSN